MLLHFIDWVTSTTHQNRISHANFANKYADKACQYSILHPAFTASRWQRFTENKETRLSKRLRSTSGSFELAETPFVLILSKSVEQRLNLFVSLTLRDTGSIGYLEELRRYFG